MPPAPPGCWWHGRERGKAGSRGGEPLCVAVDARSFLRRNGHGPAGHLRSLLAESSPLLPKKRLYDLSGKSPSLTGGQWKSGHPQDVRFSFFAALVSGGPVAENRKYRGDSLATPRAGVRDARKSVLPDMAMYDGVLLSAGHAARIPSIRQQTWQYDRLSFLRSGAGSPSPPDSDGDLPCRPEGRFFRGGESLRGGGDSFYKKRPRPLSMMPLQQRRANLRGRLYRLRPWQGCPRSWPARRGCAWRGGPGRSR